MKRNIERTTPMAIAIVRSNITVASIVTINCVAETLSFLLKIFFITDHSFILHAVTIRTPASAARGIFDITGPRRNIEAISVTEWNTLTSLVFPPDFIATLVLAIAAVAGTPPQRGIIILPIP